MSEPLQPDPTLPPPPPTPEQPPPLPAPTLQEAVASELAMDAAPAAPVPMKDCSFCGESLPAADARCPYCKYPLTEELRITEAARLRKKFLRNEPREETPIAAVDWMAYLAIMTLWPLCVILADKLSWQFSLITIGVILAAGIMALVALVKGQMHRAGGYVLSTLLGLGLLIVCWVALQRYL